MPAAVEPAVAALEVPVLSWCRLAGQEPANEAATDIMDELDCLHTVCMCPRALFSDIVEMMPHVQCMLPPVHSTRLLPVRAA